MHAPPNMTNDDPSQASSGLITCYKPMHKSKKGLSKRRLEAVRLDERGLPALSYDFGVVSNTAVGDVIECWSFLHLFSHSLGGCT